MIHDYLDSRAAGFSVGRAFWLLLAGFAIRRLAYSMDARVELNFDPHAEDG